MTEVHKYYATKKMKNSPSFSSIAPNTTLNHLTQFLFLFVGFSFGLIVGFNYDVSYFINTPSSVSTPLRSFPLPPTPSSPPPPPAPAQLFSPPPPLPPLVVEEINVPLMHNMSDDELVMKALKVDGSSEKNSKNTPKIAFMFMVKGPIPLAPLWEKFFEGHNGHYTIYVHAHPSFHSPFANDSVFYGRNIPSQEVLWGTMSMVDSEKRLLANALLDPSNQRFVLLSESCIPLFNFATIYNYFFRTKLSFLGSFDYPGLDGRGRYNQTMFPDINITQWRKASQWFEVHRDLALIMLPEQKLYNIFKKKCRKPCFSDEHYFPTMANILCPEKIHNRSVTWVDWSLRGPHPSSYGGPDINEDFLNRVKFGLNCTYNGKVTNVCNLFARKFLPNALEALLRLAPSILGFGN